MGVFRTATAALGHNPHILCPCIILTVKFVVAVKAYLTGRDWYSLYLSVSQLGVDLTYLGLGLFLTGLFRVASQISTWPLGYVVLEVSVLVLLLAIADSANGEAKRCGRERIAGRHKVPMLRIMFVTPLVDRMVDAVRRTDAYIRGARRVWWGPAWGMVSLSIGAGVIGHVSAHLLVNAK